VRIAAAVLHYRAWPEVRETLDGLLDQTRRPDELLLVDHGSGDGSDRRIATAYPDVRVVAVEANRGPAAGANHMLRAALDTGADALLLSTDDTRPASDALAQLEARLLSEPRVGAVAPLTLSRDDPERVIEAGGFVVPATWHFYPRRDPGTADDWEGAPPIEADWLQYGFMLIRAEAARVAAPFAEHYYHWGDDVDFTARLKRLGWALECVPAARVWQHIGYPSEHLVQRNWLEVINRNAPRHLLARELLRVSYWTLRDGLAPSSPDARLSARLRLRGLVDFCLRRFGPPGEQSTRKA
jgi:GT2 family glycosyltransferase